MSISPILRGPYSHSCMDEHDVCQAQGPFLWALPPQHPEAEGTIPSADRITRALKQVGWKLRYPFLATGTDPAPVKQCPVVKHHDTGWILLSPPFPFPLWPSRCWFGKRPGVYTDYIYQGPMILVLLVRALGGSK